MQGLHIKYCSSFLLSSHEGRLCSLSLLSALTSEKGRRSLNIDDK